MVDPAPRRAARDRILICDWGPRGEMPNGQAPKNFQHSNLKEEKRKCFLPRNTGKGNAHLAAKRHKRLKSRRGGLAARGRTERREVSVYLSLEGVPGSRFPCHSRLR